MHNSLFFLPRIQLIVGVLSVAFVAIPSLFCGADVGFASGRPSAPSNSQEVAHCSEITKAAQRRLGWLLNVSESQIDFPVVDVCHQLKKYPAIIDFQAAVESVFWSILRDGRHPESILALATILAFEETDLPWTEPLPLWVRQRSEFIAKEHLSASATRVRLLGSDECAEDGECVSDHWIFRIKVPTLSDHIHYVIVDRYGLRPVYNYGFN